jgi:hypothetical protein
MEHLKFNYGEFRQAEEKKRRVTLAAMPSQCHKKDAFFTSDHSERVNIFILCGSYFFFSP